MYKSSTIVGLRPAHFKLALLPRKVIHYALILATVIDILGFTTCATAEPSITCTREESSESCAWRSPIEETLHTGLPLQKLEPGLVSKRMLGSDARPALVSAPAFGDWVHRVQWTPNTLKQQLHGQTLRGVHVQKRAEFLYSTEGKPMGKPELGFWKMSGARHNMLAKDFF